jgi:hypothetical protein
MRLTDAAVIQAPGYGARYGHSTPASLVERAPVREHHSGTEGQQGQHHQTAHDHTEPDKQQAENRVHGIPPAMSRKTRPVKIPAGVRHWNINNAILHGSRPSLDWHRKTWLNRKQQSTSTRVTR